MNSASAISTRYFNDQRFLIIFCGVFSSSKCFIYMSSWVKYFQLSRRFFSFVHSTFTWKKQALLISSVQSFHRMQFADLTSFSKRLFFHSRGFCLVSYQICISFTAAIYRYGLLIDSTKYLPVPFNNVLSIDGEMNFFKKSYQNVWFFVYFFFSSLFSYLFLSLVGSYFSLLGCPINMNTQWKLFNVFFLNYKLNKEKNVSLIEFNSICMFSFWF